MTEFELPLTKEQHAELTRLNDVFIESVCAGDEQTLFSTFDAMRVAANSICGQHGRQFLDYNAYSFSNLKRGQATMYVVDKRKQE
jgi:hypothetical protein